HPQPRILRPQSRDLHLLRRDRLALLRGTELALCLCLHPITNRLLRNTNLSANLPDRFTTTHSPQRFKLELEGLRYFRNSFHRPPPTIYYRSLPLVPDNRREAQTSSHFALLANPSD